MWKFTFFDNFDLYYLLELDIGCASLISSLTEEISD